MNKLRTRHITTTLTGNLSALGNSQQRDFNFIGEILNDNEILKHFAEPVLTENQEKIDWYTAENGTVKSFDDFSELEIRDVKADLSALMGRLEQISVNARSELEREAINNLSRLPDQQSIKMVGSQVIIINWAYRIHRKGQRHKSVENFAGLAEPTGGPSKLDQSSTINVEDNLNKKGSLDGSPGVPPADINLKDPISDVAKDKPKVGPELEKDDVAKGSWFWLSVAIFLILLLLNALMLKDACGVRGLGFLYFC